MSDYDWKPVCDCCESDDIAVAADAFWDKAKQVFVLAEQPQDPEIAMCHDCECYRPLRWKQIEWIRAENGLLVEVEQK